MSDEVLVKVDNVSKKFCRDLKKSLWYGLQDVGTELIGKKYDHELRPDEFWSLKDISFEIKRGECLGLIGPNGAGKSTLLKMLNGLIKPDRGSITLKGRVGALIELGAGFNPILSGLENIYNQGAVLGLTKKEIDQKLDAIIEFSELAEFLNMPVQNYSSGMKVRLGFAVASQLEPDVLILDEVLAVGDVKFQAKCFNNMYQMMQKTAVIFVSHAMSQIARVCSELLILNKGQSLFSGKEVSIGINKFLALMKNNDESDKLIIGDGSAVIHKIELESVGKKEIYEINYLDNLSINIETTIDKNIKIVDVAIFVLTEDLTPIIHCCSYYDEMKIINQGEILRLKIDLGKIPLRTGEYSLTVAILEHKLGSILVKHHNVNKFNVKGRHVAYAPIQLKANWNILD